MKAGRRHETPGVVALYVCRHELGRRGGLVLLRDRKEGRVVEEQVVTHAQEIKEAQPQVEVIRDLERFNAIAPEWDRLVTQWGSDGLFLSHTWFRTWWESFGEGNELHIVTVRSGSELVAAAPMM